MTPFCQNYQNLILFPIVISKISSGARGQFFFEFEIFVVRFGISVLKEIKMSGVASALTKKIVITTLSIVHQLTAGDPEEDAEGVGDLKGMFIEMI